MTRFVIRQSKLCKWNEIVICQTLTVAQTHCRPGWQTWQSTVVPYSLTGSNPKLAFERGYLLRRIYVPTRQLLVIHHLINNPLLVTPMTGSWTRISHHLETHASNQVVRVADKTVTMTVRVIAKWGSRCASNWNFHHFLCHRSLLQYASRRIDVPQIIPRIDKRYKCTLVLI
jgi:hypothetical protein